MIIKKYFGEARIESVNEFFFWKNGEKIIDYTHRWLLINSDGSTSRSNKNIDDNDR